MKVEQLTALTQDAHNEQTMMIILILVKVIIFGVFCKRRGTCDLPLMSDGIIYKRINS